MKEKSYMDQLTLYIKKNLKKGYTQESLRWALINQGNSKIEVSNAFKRVNEELAKQAPELKAKPIIKHEIIEPKEYASVRTNSSGFNLFGWFKDFAGF
jgi:uncharacterized protein Smg (DUF494 family)